MKKLNTSLILSFNRAKNLVQSKNIRRSEDYKKWYKKERPLHLPLSPHIFYENLGWNGWRDFLGTTFPSYEEAKQIMRDNDIRSSHEYEFFYKKLNLPVKPKDVYANKGWISWDDFTGEKRKRIKKEKIKRKKLKLKKLENLFGIISVIRSAYANKEDQKNNQ